MKLFLLLDKLIITVLGLVIIVFPTQQKWFYVFMILLISYFIIEGLYRHFQQKKP